jgi:heme-degrading monooxygenase HmoA
MTVAMAQLGQPFTSGNWLVQAGNEKEFVNRWSALALWSQKEAQGAQFVYLIQDSRDPRHFLSFGAWESADAVRTWRQQPKFSELLGACRELCDEFEAHDYTLASAPGNE